VLNFTLEKNIREKGITW